MSETQPENNTFDGFEKIEQTPEELVQDTNQVSSSDDLVDEDVYSKSPEREEPPPLVDLDDKPSVTEDFTPTPIVQKNIMKSDPAPCFAGDRQTFCCNYWMKNVDHRVLDLVYWRDVRRSGIVFASLLLLLISFAMYSALMVFAYVSMAVLAVTISFRIYRQVLAAVQKTGDAHPFKSCLEEEIVLPADRVQAIVDVVLSHTVFVINQARRLFFVADFVDSLKFGVCLWILSYAGACFNGITLVIIAVIKLFTLPKVYETYKVPIDAQLCTISKTLSNVYEQVQAKIPMLKKKEE